MLKKIETSNAPQAIGPYSQAIQVGDLIYTSGQIPFNEKNERIQGDIEQQTHQVLKNLQAILEEAGSDFEHVIKTTVFLKDINHFEQMNQVYASYFPNHKPARSCVEVSRLPKDVLVEIEVVAKKK